MVEIADTVREGKKVRISQKDGTTEERGDMDRGYAVEKQLQPLGSVS